MTKDTEKVMVLFELGACRGSGAEGCMPHHHKAFAARVRNSVIVQIVLPRNETIEVWTEG